MGYKKILRLHFANHLGRREIAENCSDCSKTIVNKFLKRFEECQELSHPLLADVVNEYIEGLLDKKPSMPAAQIPFHDFDKEACLQGFDLQRGTPETPMVKIQHHRCRR